MKGNKAKHKGLLFGIILVCIFLSFSGCRSKMTESTQHKTDRVFTNRYMESLKGITSTDYEGYWISQKILFFEMSGKDMGYRGIIYIDEAEAQRLKDDYDDWFEETSPLPAMKDVNLSSVAGCDWYYSPSFTSEFSVLLQINDMRFNGKDAVIFDVHTF